jgi:hypothetical protein
MGYGEVTGNGSVHWRIDHEQGDGDLVFRRHDGRPRRDHEVYWRRHQASGRDPKDSDHFRVRVQFPDADEARAQLRELLDSLPPKGPVEFTIRVPAARKGDPDDPPGAEVRVEW